MYLPTSLTPEQEICYPYHMRLLRIFVHYSIFLRTHIPLAENAALFLPTSEKFNMRGKPNTIILFIYPYPARHD